MQVSFQDFVIPNKFNDVKPKASLFPSLFSRFPKVILELKQEFNATIFILQPKSKQASNGTILILQNFKTLSSSFLQPRENDAGDTKREIYIYIFWVKQRDIYFNLVFYLILEEIEFYFRY